MFLIAIIEFLVENTKKVLLYIVHENHLDQFLKMFIKCRVLIEILFDCVLLKNKKTCNKSACQVSYRRVLMTKKLACCF